MGGKRYGWAEKGVVKVFEGGGGGGGGRGVIAQMQSPLPHLRSKVRNVSTSDLDLIIFVSRVFEV